MRLLLNLYAGLVVFSCLLMKKKAHSSPIGFWMFRRFKRDVSFVFTENFCEKWMGTISATSTIECDQNCTNDMTSTNAKIDIHSCKKRNLTCCSYACKGEVRLENLKKSRLPN